jgi:uncharacterized protein
MCGHKFHWALNSNMMITANNGARLRLLNSGSGHDRSHWQHGPIDIVTDLHGSDEAIGGAKQAMWERFVECLPELVSELKKLRTSCNELLDGTSRNKEELTSFPFKGSNVFTGPIAQRMLKAVFPYQSQFITPMAAVAGSVAQELLEIAKRFELSKAIVNNGGDIAMFAKANENITIALLAPVGHIDFSSEHSIEYGIATSGWSGRSFSLGIADAVTVVAPTAAQADAAATMIANAVGCDLEHHAIERKPAQTLKDDCDLGMLPVTTKVGLLPLDLVKLALTQGQAFTQTLLDKKLILCASLSLQGRSVIVTTSPRFDLPYQIKLAQ